MWTLIFVYPYSASFDLFTSWSWKVLSGSVSLDHMSSLLESCTVGTNQLNTKAHKFIIFLEVRNPKLILWGWNQSCIALKVVEENLFLLFPISMAVWISWLVAPRNGEFFFEEILYPLHSALLGEKKGEWHGSGFLSFLSGQLIFKS